MKIQDGEITIETHDPTRLFESLPGWLSELGIQVTEMHTMDESLQALFNALMKMHRGEL